MKTTLLTAVIFFAASSAVAGPFDVAWNPREGKPDLLVLTSDSPVDLAVDLMEGFVARKRQEGSRPYVRFWRYPERWLLPILKHDPEVDVEQTKYCTAAMFILFDHEYERIYKKARRNLEDEASKRKAARTGDEITR